MDRSVINDLRRIEEDREEEIEWEKGERRRVEEEKKLWWVICFGFGLILLRVEGEGREGKGVSAGARAYS